jgi:flagellar biosynthetic protein FliR
MLIFLTLGLHHVWISALADSFRLIPGGTALPQAGLGVLLIEVTAGVFVTAMQLAAPLLVALLFAMAALGLVARTVPQMNVFAMSFPVSFFLGLVIYAATIPFFPSWMQDHFEGGQEHLFAALRLLRG